MNGNMTLKIILTAAAASLAVMEETNVSMEETVLNIFIAPSLLLGDRHSYHARHRQRRNRKSWRSFTGYLTDHQFHWYFRISKELFQTLCNDIEGIVGEESFKSEEYLSSIMNKTMTDLTANIFHAHLCSTGRVISGEIRLKHTWTWHY